MTFWTRLLLAIASLLALCISEFVIIEFIDSNQKSWEFIPTGIFLGLRKTFGLITEIEEITSVRYSSGPYMEQATVRHQDGVLDFNLIFAFIYGYTVGFSGKMEIIMAYLYMIFYQLEKWNNKIWPQFSTDYNNCILLGLLVFIWNISSSDSKQNT